jgi:cytochrome c oxidase assembly factor CtaG
MDLTAWSWDPAVLVGVAIAGGLYTRGWQRLRRRSRLQAWCFGGGLAVVVLALCSPIGTYDQQLFSLHMVEHLLLTIGAPPLLLLGKPLLPLLWGLPDQERRGAARWLAPRSALVKVFGFLADPKVALALFVLSFAVWHVPMLYDAAEGQSVVHYLEHGVFFSTALLFWWPVIHPSGGTRTLSRVAAIGYFSVPMFESTLIGALLTFATRPFYATYIQAPRITSLSAVDDQQLAGLIMWIPGGLIYVAAILWLLAALLREEEDIADRELREAAQPHA